MIFGLAPPNVISLSFEDSVTGERQIQTLTDGLLLRPLCSIASRILFYLDVDPPGEESGKVYGDLKTQSDNRGPLWATVVKLSKHETSVATKVDIPVLINRIIFALELTSLNVAPSSFFYQICRRAAANVLGPPKEFAYKTCKGGIKCPRSKKLDIRPTLDPPTFIESLTQLPDFDPNEEELNELLANVRIPNRDKADNSCTVCLRNSESQHILVGHPGAHVVLAIMRTGARSFMQDINDDLVAQKQSELADSLQDYQASTWTGGNEFEEQYTCVMQQVNQYTYSTSIFLISSDPGLG
jgi:hypothetical protein